MSHHFKKGVFYMKNMEFGMTLLGPQIPEERVFSPKNSNGPNFLVQTRRTPTKFADFLY